MWMKTCMARCTHMYADGGWIQLFNCLLSCPSCSSLRSTQQHREEVAVAFNLWNSWWSDASFESATEDYRSVGIISHWSEVESYQILSLVCNLHDYSPYGDSFQRFQTSWRKSDETCASCPMAGRLASSQDWHTTVWKLWANSAPLCRPIESVLSSESNLYTSVKDWLLL